MLVNASTDKVRFLRTLSRCRLASHHELVALVPILRAGLGMLEGTLEMLPFATVWHLGLYRNEETLEPVQYYNKMKAGNVAQASSILILDPMLATGGSIVAAISTLKEKGAQNIKVISLISFAI